MPLVRGEIKIELEGAHTHTPSRSTAVRQDRSRKRKVIKEVGIYQMNTRTQPAEQDRLRFVKVPAVRRYSEKPRLLVYMFFPGALESEQVN